MSMNINSHSESDPSSGPQGDPRQKRSGLWIGAMVFICGWVFFLGVIVGRGSAPALFDYKKIESEISLLAKNFTDSRKAQKDVETDIVKIHAEMEYPEKLKKKTEAESKLPMPVPEKPIKPAETPMPVPEKPVKPAQIEAVHAPPPSPPSAPVKSELQPAAKPEPVETAAETTPTKTAPEARIKSMYDLKASQARETAPERTASAPPERTPASVSRPQQPPASDNKTVSAQPVAIQMNSLMDRKSADALIESLRSKGISASKTQKMVQGKGICYQVVVGRYASSTEADAVLNRLRQDNMDASLVKQ